MELLRKLDVDDLERLKSSVIATVKADEAPRMTDSALLYRTAAEVNPYNDLALMSCGVALVETGNVHDGIKWVERALEVNPENARARSNLEAIRRDL